MNAVDRSGPMGYSTFTRDANGVPTGIQSGFSAEMRPGFTRTAAAFGDVAGRLPADGFDSSKISPVDELGRTMYRQGISLARDDFADARERHRVEMDERGLPVGDVAGARAIATRQLNDSQNKFATDLALRSNMAAYDQRERDISNARQDHMMPYQELTALNQNLGLLNGMLPQAQQQTASASAGQVDYGQLMQSQYKAQQAAYDSKMRAYGDLAKLGVGLAMAPVAGPAGLGGTLAGSLVSGMFNSPQPAASGPLFGGGYQP